MKSKPSSNYNSLNSNSAAIKVAYKAKLAMFSMFMEKFRFFEGSCGAEAGYVSFKCIQFSLMGFDSCSQSEMTG